MRFRTRLNDGESSAPRPISYPKTRPVLQLVADKNGKRSVKKVGETNFYQQTQEAKADTLIYNLIDQYQRNGDASIFGEPSIGGLIDTVGMPTTLMEAENIRLQAKTVFDNLSIEERNKYGQDFTKFLADVDNRIAKRAAELEAAKANPTSAPEVKDV